MLKAKNLESDGLAQDLWNHIAFLIGQQWQLRGEIRAYAKRYPNLMHGTGLDWDKSKYATRKMEINWLRDIAMEHEGAI